MSDFAIQFNKNRFEWPVWLPFSVSFYPVSFGMVPAGPLYVQSPLFPNQPFESSLELKIGKKHQKFGMH